MPIPYLEENPEQFSLYLSRGVWKGCSKIIKELLAPIGTWIEAEDRACIPFPKLYGLTVGERRSIGSEIGGGKNVAKMVSDLATKINKETGTSWDDISKYFMAPDKGSDSLTFRYGGELAEIGDTRKEVSIEEATVTIAFRRIVPLWSLEQTRSLNSLIQEEVYGYMLNEQSQWIVDQVGEEVDMGKPILTDSEPIPSQLNPIGQKSTGKSKNSPPSTPEPSTPPTIVAPIG